MTDKDSTCPQSNSETYICSRCKIEKPFSEFYQRKDRKVGIASFCKECDKKRQQTLEYKSKRKEYHKKYYKTYQRKRSREDRRNEHLKNKFNITLKDYNKMFEAQQGCCLICGKHQSEFKKALAVDHSHNTGQIRGLLCNICNTSLGWFETHKSAVELYLEKKDKEYPSDADTCTSPYYPDWTWRPYPYWPVTFTSDGTNYTYEGNYTITL